MSRTWWDSQEDGDYVTTVEDMLMKWINELADDMN